MAWTCGLEGFHPEYLPFQQAALALHMKYGQAIHGLSWESMHRNQPGRVYALWHEHKATVQLSIMSTSPYGRLVDDAEWQSFLDRHPEIEAIDD